MSGFLYLDAEAIGLSPERGARLVETEIDESSGRTVFNPLIHPRTRIPREAVSIRGVTNAMIRSKPRIDDSLPQSLKLISGQDVVVHNAAFDI